MIDSSKRFQSLNFGLGAQGGGERKGPLTAEKSILRAGKIAWTGGQGPGG